jgi:protein-S-isoprenylcysteine O-methyltransferase Ste14
MKTLLEKILAFGSVIIGSICCYLFINDSFFVFSSMEIIGVSLLVVGMIFLIYSSLYLGKSFSTKLTPKSTLKTTGPYNFVRHPIYLGWMIFFLGAEVFSQSVMAIPFIVLLYLLLVVRAKFEEINLEKKFSREWRKYKMGVGFLLPKVIK